MLAVLFFTKCSDGYVPHRSLEFDQGVSGVVVAGWECFTIGAEISVVADCALVAVPTNESLRTFGNAQGTVTVYAIMELCSKRWVRNGFVEGHKSMSRVSGRGRFQAARAIVPVRAVHAFVADTVDIL